jgi:hypothetical protein
MDLTTYIDSYQFTYLDSPALVSGYRHRYGLPESVLRHAIQYIHDEADREFSGASATLSPCPLCGRRTLVYDHIDGDIYCVFNIFIRPLSGQMSCSWREGGPMEDPL